MYESLLLNCGGSFIDSASLPIYTGNPVIAIGLGGIGTDCLQTLKQQICSRFRPDSSATDFQEYYDAYVQLSNHAGIHLYEGTPGDSRNWHDLPNPVPEHLISSSQS